MIKNSPQKYNEKENASKFLKAFESYQNRTKNKIGTPKRLYLKAYQEIVVPKSYLTCFRHFVGIYNGQDNLILSVKARKFQKKARMALISPSSSSPVHSLLFTLSTFSLPRHPTKKGFSVLENHLLYKFPQIHPKT